MLLFNGFVCVIHVTACMFCMCVYWMHSFEISRVLYHYSNYSYSRDIVNLYLPLSWSRACPCDLIWPVKCELTKYFLLLAALKYLSHTLLIFMATNSRCWRPWMRQLWSRHTMCHEIDMNEWEIVLFNFNPLKFGD